ncbi:uncharacterized protein [Rutidosis leptorrhynchoides]|uniref:uncharacterized protein n=1 Tax=Rutidosis leptorrhynchoides TaxID=125765 RepID=UPI003A98CFD4
MNVLGMSCNVCVHYVSAQLWHGRLGHPSDQVLTVLKHKLDLKDFKENCPCDICHKAKHTREPFPLSDHKSQGLDEQDFKDKWYCASNFCVYTPQQNGIAERKHRHLLNVARALMFQGRTLSSVLFGMTPYEYFFKKEPSLSHLRCFGCLCHATVLNTENKFSSRDHFLFDQIFQNDQNVLSPNDDVRAAYDGDGSSTSGYTSDHSPTNGSNPSNRDSGLSEGSSTSTTPMDNISSPEGNTFLNDNTTSYVHTQTVRRSSKESVLPKRFDDYVLNGKVKYGIEKIKYNSNGEIERYKARLVAKGYSQKEEIDYDETFTHVIKHVTLRCIITLAVQNDWPLFQFDVNNAFLYGDLHEEIYMKLPEGYFTKDETKVCKLVKSLYGLKQAPRQWNHKLNYALIEHGFEQSVSYYYLYVKNTNGVFIALLVYVDDIVVTGNNLTEIENFKRFLKTKFMIKDLGVLKYFPGIEILPCNYGICMNQRKYCLELLNDYGMLGCKPMSTPIEANMSVENEPS